MEPVGKTPPGGEAAVRRGRGRRLPAPIDHIGRGGDVPVATAGAVELLTGKPVEGGTVTVPPGQAVAVRSAGRRWVGSRTAAGGAFRRLSRGWAHAAQRAYEWSASVIAACSAC